MAIKGGIITGKQTKKKPEAYYGPNLTDQKTYTREKQAAPKYSPIIGLTEEQYKQKRQIVTSLPEFGSYQYLLDREKEVGAELDKINAQKTPARNAHRYVGSGLEVGTEKVSKEYADKVAQDYQNIVDALYQYTRGIKTSGGRIDTQSEIKENQDLATKYGKVESYYRMAGEDNKNKVRGYVTPEYQQKATDVRGSRELVTDKVKAAQDYEKNENNIYDKNIFGIAAGNVRMGDIDEKLSKVGYTSFKNTTDDIDAAEIYQALQTKLIAKNKDTFNSENYTQLQSTVATISRYAPQFVNQTLASLGGEAVGGLIGFAFGNPKLGRAIGSGLASADYMYRQVAGSKFVELLQNSDLSVEDAKTLANNSAIAEAAIEFGTDFAVSLAFQSIGATKNAIKNVGKKLIKEGIEGVAKTTTKETAETLTEKAISTLVKKGVSKKGAKIIVNTAKTAGQITLNSLGEGLEEGIQSGMSITTTRNAQQGNVLSVWQIFKESANLSQYTEDDWKQIKESVRSGILIGWASGGARVGAYGVMNKVMNTVSDVNLGSTIKDLKGAPIPIKRAIEYGINSDDKTVRKIATRVYEQSEDGIENVSNKDLGALVRKAFEDKYNVFTGTEIVEEAPEPKKTFGEKVKGAVDVVKDAFGISNEQTTSTPTTPSTEGSNINLPKAKQTQVKAPVSTEGGIINAPIKTVDVQSAIERITSGTATNKDYDLFKPANAKNRQMFEDATGVKLPATNSETRKYLRGYVENQIPQDGNVVNSEYMQNGLNNTTESDIIETDGGAQYEQRDDGGHSGRARSEVESAGKQGTSVSDWRQFGTQRVNESIRVFDEVRPDSQEVVGRRRERVTWNAHRNNGPKSDAEIFIDNESKKYGVEVEYATDLTVTSANGKVTHPVAFAMGNKVVVSDKATFKDVAHEFVHHIRKSNPRKYNAIRSYIKNNIKSGLYDFAFDSYKTMYSEVYDFGDFDAMTDEERARATDIIEEELVCDITAYNKVGQGTPIVNEEEFTQLVDELFDTAKETISYTSTENQNNAKPKKSPVKDFLGKLDFLPLPKTKNGNIKRNITQTTAEQLINIIDDYAKTGQINQQMANALFDTLYNSSVVESVENFDEAVNYIKGTKLYISPEDKGTIPDFNKFRQSMMKKVNITTDSTKGGLSTDVFFEEFTSMFPGMVDESLTHPADQLQALADFVTDAKSKQTQNLDDYFGEGAESAKEQMREMFNEELEAFVKGEEIRFSSGDRSKQYGVMWTIAEGFATDQDIAIFYNEISKISNGKQVLTSFDGDYIVDVNNKLFYTDGNYESPLITKVIIFDTEYENEMVDAKELILNEERIQSSLDNAVETIENLFGQGFVSTRNFEDYRTSQRYDGRAKGNKSKRDTSRNAVKDAIYEGAVKRNDSETIFDLLRERQEKSGYSTDTDWRMNHRAPNSDGGTPFYQMNKVYGSDIYTERDIRRAAYMFGDGAPFDSKAIVAIRNAQNNPDAMVTIYRAVPLDIRDTRVRNGDWITTVKEYAEEHGSRQFDDEYRIIENKVPAKHIWGNGDSVHEYGYDNGNPYEVYANVENNVKLDEVTYDDNGNLIPLSNRYDKTNPDIRYSTGTTEKTAEYYNQRYAELLEEYGAIKKGAQPRVEESETPKRSSQNKYVSQYARTMAESGLMKGEMEDEFKKMVVEGKMSHEVFTDKMAEKGAEARVKFNGFDESVEQFQALVKEGRMNKEDIALGQMLFNLACQNKDTKLAMELAIDLSLAATQYGQNVQAFSMLKKMSPDGQLYYLEKSLQKINRDLLDQYKGKFKEIKIDPKLAENLLNSKSQEEMNEAVHAIEKNIGEQLPSSPKDKWNAWRYLSMLGNTRTHFRNIVGNAMFYPVVKIKDLVATSIESVVLPNKDRTKSFTKTDDSKAFAAKDWEVMKEVVKGNDGKYGLKQGVEEYRKIFNPKWLEALRKFNTNALNTEDEWFLAPYYKNAFAGAMTARGLTSEFLNSGTKEANEALVSLRKYALQEAQRGTYRDANAFSEFVENIRLRETNVFFKGANALVEGVLPFKKTPANILVRGIEYSPIGVVKSLYDMATKVRKGDMSASKAIDELSAGLVGTAVVGLGYLMCKAGVLVVEPDEDDEVSGYKKMLGAQNYALKIGDHTYTIDWMAPAALPLFVGAEMFNTVDNTEKMSFTALCDALTRISEPAFELSCLSGVQNALQSIKYAEGGEIIFELLGSMATSYVQQALPTIGGQLARTIDNTKRNAYYKDKNSDMPEFLNSFIQQAAAKIPFATYMLPEKVDRWGRIEKYGSLPERVLENFVSPGYYSKDQSTLTDKKLLELYEKTGDASILPDVAAKSFQVDGEREYLSADEYVEYSKIRGSLAYEYITKFMTELGTNTLDNSKKVEVIKSLYGYANAKAKTKVSDYALDEHYQKVEKAKNAGISPDKYYVAYHSAKGFVSDKNSKGNSIQYSKSRKEMQAIKKNVKGLSEKSLYRLFEIMGYSENQIKDFRYNLPRKN